MQLTEEYSGQYSMFGTNEDSIIKIDEYQSFIQNIDQEIKRLQTTINKIIKLDFNGENASIFLNSFKLDCQRFVEYVISFCAKISLDKIVEKYEDDASLWHKLNKILLFYLDNFIYVDNSIELLNNPNIASLENIILIDQIKYKEEYYRKALEKIHDLKKIRLENFIIYDASKFLAHLEVLETQYNKEDLESVKNNKIKEFFNNRNIIENMFVSEIYFEDEKINEALSMLLLYYLSCCVYNNDCNSNKMFIKKVETYVVSNYPKSYILHSNQQKAYEVAKQNVGNRIAEYINKEYDKILNAIKDYDFINQIINKDKLLMVEKKEKLSNLPQGLNSEEIKKMLESFLGSVFLLKFDLSKENSPIFLTEFENERYKSFKLALVYLNRYVYSSDNSNQFVETIENYIFSDNNFKLESGDLIELFTTKSKLNNRVVMRNALGRNQIKKVYK